MLSLIPESDVPDPTLPAAFEGRASTQLSTLTVDQARRYLKVQIKAFYAALAVAGVVLCAFLSFIAWPLFLIALLFSWFCYSVIGTWWEAHKKSQAEIIKGSLPSLRNIPIHLGKSSELPSLYSSLN
jgi:hypothetical protein